MAEHPYGFDAQRAVYTAAQEVERRVFSLLTPRVEMDSEAIKQVDPQELMWLLAARTAVAVVDALHDTRESVAELGGI